MLKSTSFHNNEFHHIRPSAMVWTLPLEGVRVLELGTYLAAPLATLHLAGLGASVCAVVRPDDSRGATSERGVWLRLEHPQQASTNPDIDSRVRQPSARTQSTLL